MTVYEQWNDLIQNLDDQTSKTFQENYYAKEQAVYEVILCAPGEVVKGTFEELAQRFSFPQAEFAGFMEGINTSLVKPVELNKLKPSTKIALQVDFEKLYVNMHEAKAQWLYELPQWDGVLTQDKRKALFKQFRDSKQAKSTKVDRNAPCPCGSGKKYKKCCGANQ
jgi:hypothetical protein